MRNRSILIAAALATAFAAAPASACAVHTPLDIRGVRSADLVVVGRIYDYRTDSRQGAHFDLGIDEVLRGRAGRSLMVRIEPTLFGAPRSAPRGRVLIALRAAGAGPGPGPAFAVLQGACSPAFILPAGSAQAVAARRLLRPGAARSR